MKRLLVFLMLVGCADAAVLEQEPYTEHEESSDFEVVTDETKGDEFDLTFDEDSIVSDATFGDTQMFTVQDVQNFLENTPYQRPTYLSTEIVGDRLAADVIVDVAQQNGINPLMLLARLQVEGSHIAKRSRPSQRSVDRALGCGCFDGQSCQSQFLGLEKQLQCAAETMSKLMTQSRNGTGQWRLGKSKRALDGIRVTPENHATAAMYGYTPWVLPRRGGNWLVWNITQRFLKHMGQLEPPRASAWIGATCQSDADCDFESGGTPGFCYDFVDVTGTSRGICSLPCEGYCPDKAGQPFTFCIASDTPQIGICTTRAVSSNNFCESVPGTVAVEADRFLGTSNASPAVRSACVPNVR